ncbi:hypothetical protein XELAEV_18045157mg [Xenopus laevis]|uniref:Uncharacterized protein n=1 Tax=Xenopus laevis TaxID=8355 RepID=A0A974H4G0_XENLA|nr:hypothetical protein XELAEV_18045157mg [Xenopus laevis]
MSRHGGKLTNIAPEMVFWMLTRHWIRQEIVNWTVIRNLTTVGQAGAPRPGYSSGTPGIGTRHKIKLMVSKQGSPTAGQQKFPRTVSHLTTYSRAPLSLG